ncbi:vWA domain-containing protein [Sandaracinus amylolyticus]|uniref:vWA domain-containing protein n=1 Tax=Sandaracinus amylolyticus TaxID=927083 RepID=UPI00069F3421|nr:VWA domain-containing protein [Sandaracinus amylolyticus]
MIVPFLYVLRSQKVPVGTTEVIQLARALEAGLHDSSLDGFYHVARAILVHSEAHYDAFDQAFAHHFRGAELQAKELRKELLEWLEEAIERPTELTDEERAMLEQYDLETLKRMFEERLNEQTERHDGGNRWIGTGGTSPFGNSGAAPRPGIRVGGRGGGRSAVQIAQRRAWQGYRDDLTLDVRQMQVALRKLRAFAREGAQDELDIQGSIDATAKNAGELEVVLRPPRRPNVRVLLVMDVGGSMEPYAHLCSRLFSAASKATHFKELRHYYFHNCVYGHVYEDEKFTKPKKVRDLLAECGPHYKLIMVGDALMAPYELLQSGGSIDLGDENRVEGIRWLQTLQEHFERSCWLNPEPEKYWSGNTIEYVKNVFDMFPLTVHGLGEAVGHLTKGKGLRKAG